MSGIFARLDNLGVSNFQATWGSRVVLSGGGFLGGEEKKAC
jgi:hypothetical protein